MGRRRNATGAGARAWAVLAVAAALVAGCSSGPGSSAESSPPALERAAGSTTTAAPEDGGGGDATTTSTTAPAVAGVGPGGVPVAADDPAGLAAQIAEAEAAVRDPSTPPDELAAMAHLQQVAYRQLGRHPAWDGAVLQRVPDGLRAAVAANAAARRELASLHAAPVPTVPAWRIVEPPSPDQLLAWYVEAERRYGVPWFYLAAVNLVETGMGRIRGTSTAGALGPMQFMPATWAAYGQGGDVHDHHDAVMGAANYLAANGAPADMGNALWHYNHSWAYVRGVTHYATVMRDDTRAFHGYYHWPVYVTTTAGDVLLPEGYEETEPVPVGDWLRRELQGG